MSGENLCLGGGCRPPKRTFNRRHRAARRKRQKLARSLRVEMRARGEPTRARRFSLAIAELVQLHGRGPEHECHALPQRMLPTHPGLQILLPDAVDCRNRQGGHASAHHVHGLKSIEGRGRCCSVQQKCSSRARSEQFAKTIIFSREFSVVRIRMGTENANAIHGRVTSGP